MAKYRKKPVVIEATQWFKNGDHPEDGDERFASGEFAGELYEGKVVRYFRRPDVSGDKPCEKCGKTMHVHGWIDTLEGGHIVCPADWIITGVQGERYPCKPDIFAATYEVVDAPRPETGEAVAWDEGKVWSFIRTLIEQGRAIQQDDAAGKYPTYEHLAARVDQAARERTAEFVAKFPHPAPAPAPVVTAEDIAWLEGEITYHELHDDPDEAARFRRILTALQGRPEAK